MVSMKEKKNQNKAFVARKLVNLKLKEGRFVAEHLSEFLDLVNQMVTMKLIIEDELQALLLMSSLLDNWETLVVLLSNSAPNGVLQLAMVKDSLFNEETRRKDVTTPPQLCRYCPLWGLYPSWFCSSPGCAGEKASTH